MSDTGAKEMAERVAMRLARESLEAAAEGKTLAERAFQTMSRTGRDAAQRKLGYAQGLAEAARRVVLLAREI